MSTVTSAPVSTASSRVGRRPHAEFMQIWEEGYVSRQISFESMHTPGGFIVSGGTLRRADGSLDRARILAYVDAVVASDPVFRLRLQRSFLGLTPPAWVPDEDFDLSRHVVFVDEPADLAAADIRELAGAYDGTMPIDHPLWRIRVTPLTGGDVLVGTMLHHATLDGMSGMKVMSGITQKSADEELPDPVDPFADARAARRVEMPYLALREWWGRLASPKPRAAWRSYRAKPFLRRVRRVLARNILPLRYAADDAARARALPPRHSAWRRLDAAVAGRRAREHGGTLSDLLAAAIIGAWDGPQRVVRLRFPVSFHNPAEPHIRNHVRDMAVTGDADASLDATIASVHAQVAERDAAFDHDTVPGFPIGYSTLLPWVSRPRYFCGGEVRAIIPFPASLGHDQFAAAGIMYNGSLFIGANMPIDRDVDGTVARMADLLVGPGREEAS
ncbi:wax ester/triacylglycerol synthase family O-acyltransferase [Microbacterium sp. ET2]|uniref:wax ester/triacylglycerol synthase domain-containing protein n=1 Tax=Microbacterium albipurpureum TaxID=3050384 RepID=UPI00259CAC40|nr:wax ester/triacylglycerol synthase domain-containing protein [Microbacterium sp. ET2 (Ac-2212)]WJL94725.1 wax ester/triacylglycerol synthase family O-acyltransferase [Microbacterium sp. ET2 (Ac-2212)]